MLAITGSGGLLGSCVALESQKRNIPFRALVREGRSQAAAARGIAPSAIVSADILDMPALLKAFEGVDTVVHCAAIVSFNPREKELLYDVNVGGTRNVVNACIQQGVRRLIHVSSVAAFGRQKSGGAINENTRWSAGVKQTDYGTSKYLAELEVFRGMEEGLQTMFVNPSVILAAADGLRSSSRFFSYAQSERLFYTDSTVSYVDARDVVEIIFRLLNHPGNGERFIANAGEISVGKLLHTIAAKLRKRPPSIRLNGTFMDVFAFVEDIRSRITGSAPVVSKQSLMLLKDSMTFDNTKVKTQLGIEFQALDSTLDWCCTEFLNFTTNK